MMDGYLANTGKIIKEYLDEYNVDIKTFKELSKLSNSQWKSYCRGNFKITNDILDSLSELIPTIQKSYWINLDKKYHEYVEKEFNSFTIDEKNLTKIARVFKFDEVFKGLGYTRLKQAIEMLKILGISSFDEFSAKYSNLAIDFMEDGGELEPIAVWLKLCEEEVPIQNNDISSVPFNAELLNKNLSNFKKLALMKDSRGFNVNCRKLCNRLGINLVINCALTNSKVRGALTTVEGNPTIYISGRFKTHDHVWFAFMHEIGHLILHYEIDKSIVTMEDDGYFKEDEASQFARDFFINQNDYDKFISSNEYTIKSKIIGFANEQKIQPGIVVGRLQHDGHIAMSSMNELKIRINFE